MPKNELDTLHFGQVFRCDVHTSFHASSIGLSVSRITSVVAAEFDFKGVPSREKNYNA